MKRDKGANMLLFLALMVFLYTFAGQAFLMSGPLGIAALVGIILTALWAIS